MNSNVKKNKKNKNKNKNKNNDDDIGEVRYWYFCNRSIFFDLNYFYKSWMIE